MLDLAHHILELCPEKLNDPIVFVNRCQLEKRKFGQLSKEMIGRLLAMKLDSPSKELLFCIDVLLENRLESEHVFHSLDENVQNEYKEYPIYHMYRSLFT
ncbi:hypothetical protein [Paenibacillus sp. SI8]|uniref:hypothetical protein n=1 Tax=unclassified Paenibacillus TaxID=185978 RepID=UPI0034653081